jgi:hypothetical protein
MKTYIIPYTSFSAEHSVFRGDIFVAPGHILIESEVSLTPTELFNKAKEELAMLYDDDESYPCWIGSSNDSDQEEGDILAQFFLEVENGIITMGDLKPPR